MIMLSSAHLAHHTLTLIQAITDRLLGDLVLKTLDSFRTITPIGVIISS